MEALTHLNALRQGAISTHTVNDFLAENGPKPAIIYKAGTQEKLYETVIDWQTLTIIKGIVFGLYLEMRHDGVQMLANEILMQEGVMQHINPKQQARLDYYDGILVE